jgi:hypothetical protein
MGWFSYIKNFNSRLGESLSSETFTLLRRKFPNHPTRTYTHEEELGFIEQYEKQKKSSLIYALLFVTALPIPIAWVLYIVYKSIVILSLDKGAVFYPPVWILFSITGLFISFSLMMSAVMFLQRLTIKNYDDYLQFCDDRMGLDNKAIAAGFTRVSLILLMVTLFFSCSVKVILDNDHISFRKLVDIRSHDYAYTEIASIVQYNGKENEYGRISDHKTHKVVFKDGNEFTSDFYFDDFGDSRLFVERISKLTHLPIQEIAFVPYTGKKGLSDNIWHHIKAHYIQLLVFILISFFLARSNRKARL